MWPDGRVAGKLVMPTVIDNQDQIGLGNIDPNDVLFYARFVNTNNLTTFASTVSEGNGDWVVHFYGDSAVVCATTSPLSPKGIAEMLECMIGGLVKLGVKEIELVAFRGDINLFSSLFLMCQEREVHILETSLPDKLNLSAIEQRMANIKKLRGRLQVNKGAEQAPKVSRPE